MPLDLLKWTELEFSEQFIWSDSTTEIPKMREKVRGIISKQASWFKMMGRWRKDGVGKLFIHLHRKWGHLLHYLWHVIQAAELIQIRRKNWIAFIIHQRRFARIAGNWIAHKARAHMQLHMLTCTQYVSCIKPNS